MFELLVLLFTIKLLARSNILIPNIDKDDSQFHLNTIQKTTELLHVPFLKNLKIIIIIIIIIITLFSVDFQITITI